jgi:hypothetical protein
MKIKARRTEDIEVTVDSRDVIQSLKLQFYMSINLPIDSTIKDGYWYIVEDMHPSGSWQQETKTRRASDRELNIYNSLICIEQEWRDS